MRLTVLGLTVAGELHVRGYAVAESLERYSF